MAQTVEAIFVGGVLKPLESLDLNEAQRVRLIVQPIEDAPKDRGDLIRKLQDGIDNMQFFSTGTPPRRDELHDRV
jgi:predicted DNA-binding antitoxin AbrB/MazE fold protein